MNIRNLFGNKTFYKTLLAVTLPLVVQQLITTSVQLVDNIMVGTLGESAISSVAVVNQFYFVVILVTFGVLSGAGIYSAQYFGSGDHDKLKETFRFKLLAATFVGALSFVVFTVFAQPLIALFTDSEETLQGGLDYIRIIRFAIFPWVLSVAISNTFRETGVTKPLLWISIVAILTNTALNFVLIFGLLGFPALGIVGAAIATLIARVVEFALSVLLLVRRGHIFSTRLSGLFSISPAMLKGIMVMALPLTLNEGLWSLGQTVFLQSYSTRGEDALAAMTMTNAISQIVFVTFGALATGVAVMVGNTLGRNALDEARENARKLMATAVMFAMAMGLVLFVLSFFVIDLYDVAQGTKRMAGFNIRVNAMFIPVYTFNVVIYFTLRSGGDMRSTLMMDSGYMWAVAVPTAFALAHLTKLPVTLMFLFVQMTDIPKMFFGLHRYRKGRWVRNLATPTPLPVTE
jgi:putative MATE family efflux protein